jgi:hypothetical protein
MARPIRADQVPLEDERTEVEKRRDRQRHITRSIIAKREAVRRLGGDVGVSSANLAGDLESRLKKIDKRVTEDER